MHQGSLHVAKRLYRAESWRPRSCNKLSPRRWSCAATATALNLERHSCNWKQRSLAIGQADALELWELRLRQGVQHLTKAMAKFNLEFKKVDGRGEGFTNLTAEHLGELRVHFSTHVLTDF
jgi:hypothetical protein